MGRRLLQCGDGLQELLAEDNVLKITIEMGGAIAVWRWLAGFIGRG